MKEGRRPGAPTVRAAAAAVVGVVVDTTPRVLDRSPITCRRPALGSLVIHARRHNTPVARRRPSFCNAFPILALFLLSPIPIASLFLPYYLFLFHSVYGKYPWVSTSRALICSPP